MAQLLNVDPATITLTVAAASIIITTTVIAPSAAAALTVSATIESYDTSTLSACLLYTSPSPRDS